MFCSSSSLSNNCRSMSSFKETRSFRDRSIFVSFCSRALSINSTVDLSVSFSASRFLHVLSNSSARCFVVCCSSLDCSSSTVATTKQQRRQNLQQSVGLKVLIMYHYVHYAAVKRRNRIIWQLPLKND